MPRQKSREQGQGLIYLIIGIVVVASVMMVGGLGKYKAPKQIGQPFSPVIVTKSPAQGDSNKNLQLQTLEFITTAPPIPTAGTTPTTQQHCPYDSVKANGCSCPENSQWGNYYTTAPEEECNSTNDCPYVRLCKEQNPILCSNFRCNVPPALSGTYIGAAPAPGEGGPIIDCALLSGKMGTGQTYCIGKPVIYLYPEIPTLVNVKLSIPGEIYISIPPIEVFSGPALSEHSESNGWKDVLASPDGTLIYQNKKYSELYYESAVKTDIRPTEGIVIATSQLSEKLKEITLKLGLKDNERQEFTNYWIPKLKALNKPYILFSVLTQEQKESIDHVEITPAPDIFINFLAYFKGIDFPLAFRPLTLPANPPQRTGFTSVEWGGFIDYSSL